MKTKIEALGGMVEVDTVWGKGTKSDTYTFDPGNYTGLIGAHRQ